MLDPHTSVGIALVVFYLPILPTAIFVLVRNWNNRPRLAWYPMVTFSLLRLAGGIISLVRHSKPYDIGLIIATTVLLNVGIIPLLLSLIGVTRIILKSSLDENSRAKKALKLIRIAFIAAIVLLVASGALDSSDSTIKTSRALAQAGYVVLAVVLTLITVELLHLQTQKHRIAPEGFFYVKFALLSIPMLALRAAYGLLYEFTIQNINSIWNPLFGSAVAFSLMCLLAEYIAVLIFIYLGFHYMHHGLQPAQLNVTDGDKP